MEESKEKEVKVKKDKSIWIILLVGILVIALGCCITYIYTTSKTLNNDNIMTLEETEHEKNIIITDSVQKEEKSEKNSNTNNLLPKASKKKSIFSENKEAKNVEMKIYKNVIDDETGKKVFEVEYSIIGDNEGMLSITDANNKSIFKKKINKNIIDIVIADKTSTADGFDAFILYSDGTVGKVETDELTDLKEYNNIVRIQEMRYGEGDLTNEDDYYFCIAMVAIDKDGEAYILEILAE